MEILEYDIKPSFHKFLEEAEFIQEKYYPIYYGFSDDYITPVRAFMNLCGDAPHSFLFESAGPGALGSRYSYIGNNPVEVIKSSGDSKGKDHLEILEEKLKKYKAKPVCGLPNFFGGAVGYLGYDCVRDFDPILFNKVIVDQEDDIEAPDSYFMIFKNLVIFDHHMCRVIIVSCIKIPDISSLENKSERLVSIKQLYSDAVKEIHEMYNSIIMNKSDTIYIELPPTEISQPSNTTREEFIANVNSLKNSIETGEIIQGVISRRVYIKTRVPPFEIYRKMRVINPSPYMFYLNFGNFQIIGASPELLVKSNGVNLTTCPIAGTSRRSDSNEMDKILEKRLLEDEKELAEHSMLVDLSRNDINKVCKPESTTLNSLMRVERFSHVMHIVSEVSGELRDNCTIFDAFRSVFPAGTVTGAPKSRAMTLIYALEKKKRSIYAGSVGYFDFCGGMDSCITLRSIVLRNSIAMCQAGAGIVYDSDPDSEYTETELKLSSCFNAISLAEKENTERTHKSMYQGVSR